MKQQYRNVDFCVLPLHYLVPSVQKTLQYPNYSLTSFCTSPMDNSKAAGETRIVTLWFKKNRFSHLRCVLIHPSYAGPTSGAVFIVDVPSTIFELRLPFADMLHSDYVRRHTPYQMVVNFGFSPTESRSHYELLRETKFPTSLPLHINLSHA